MVATHDSRMDEHVGDSELSRDGTEPSATVALGATARDDPCSPSYQPLVAVVIAVSVGMVLDRSVLLGRFTMHVGDVHDLFHTASFAIWWASAFALLLAWWAMWRRHHDSASAWLLLIVAALVGACWHDLRWNMFASSEIGRFASHDSQPACVEAVALEAPQRVSAPQATPLRAIPGGEQSRLSIELTAIRDGTHWRPATGTCQLTVNGHVLGIRAGDRVRVFGQLARPVPPHNPGEFDFAAHARADRQIARLRSSAPECVTVRTPGSRWSVSRWLDALRNGLMRVVQEHVGPARAGLAAAILLGNRAGLPHDQTQQYLVTGTIHVLVVSGMNVAILAAGLLSFMQIGWISRRTGLAVIMGVVVVYAVVADIQPPVVRAAVLGVLLCLGNWVGRRGVAFNSLSAGALVVFAINPADLFRPGPQLSFLAMAALISIGNQGGLIPAGPSNRLDRAFAIGGPIYLRALVRGGRLAGWLGAPPDRLEQLIYASLPWYRRSIALCLGTIRWLIYSALAVWLVTLPLVLMHFHVASPISVLISPLVWAFVFVAMWSGFFMLILGWLVAPIGWLCGSVCSAALWGLDNVVDWAESVKSLPVVDLLTPGPAWWWVLGFYVGLIAVMLLGRAVAPIRWQVAALSAWIVIGLVPPFARMLTRNELVCSFVAVGHGTCVVLEMPNGATLLYDAGALGAPEFAAQSIASYLWHRGITTIDGIVISHADVDHYNAVPGLLERFDVKAVYVSPMMFDGMGDVEAGSGPQFVQSAIRNKAVPIREIWSGHRLSTGTNVSIDVLHPPKNGVLGSDNANSLTLAVEYDGRRLLLPGDLESPGLEDVMAELPYDCDVLLAPHHGSRHSDPPGFAAWSTPEWVIISGGDGDDVRSVADTYQAAGAQVFSTADRGAVQVSLKADGIRVIASRSASGTKQVNAP